MKNNIISLTILAASLLFSCSSNKREICNEQSEWRDHNGPDSCSFYAADSSCDQLIGRLNIMSRMHKGFDTKDVFTGGVSSRWLEIGKTKIAYFDPSGNLADEGTCSCHKGILKMKWQKGENLPEEATIYFSSSDTVELRYYDYPFSFMKMAYDSTKPPTNPTKIFGTIVR